MRFGPHIVTCTGRKDKTFMIESELLVESTKDKSVAHSVKHLQVTRCCAL